MSGLQPHQTSTWLHERHEMFPPAVFTIDYHASVSSTPHRLMCCSDTGLELDLSLGRVGRSHIGMRGIVMIPVASEMAAGDRNCHPMQRALSYLIARPVGTPFNPRRSPSVVAQIGSDHINGGSYLGPDHSATGHHDLHI
jgi:hypothetical protein